MDKDSDSSHMGMEPTAAQAFCRISVEEALAALEKGRLEGRSAKLFDIRDSSSFEAGHFPGAIRLGPGNIDVELEAADHQTPILIYCYHGHSSQRAAGLFAEKGFARACSIDGGWEFLRHHVPANPKQ
jgi:thiosulfate sulfurtransferase